jgi:hypothetical protein
VERVRTTTSNEVGATGLVGEHLRRYHEAMSFGQLLKRVQNLPTRQRDRLVREILALDDESHGQHERIKHVKWPDVQARAKRIVGERVLPNLVLLERGEERS